MALISCPECGKQISDKSQTCIHCGFPIASINTGAKLTIKAQQRPVGYAISWLTMDIVTSDGKKLCTIEPGQVVSINVVNDMEIYAVPTYAPDKFKDRKRSNSLKISSQKSTRVQIAFLISFAGMNHKVILNEVDIIDSD